MKKEILLLFSYLLKKETFCANSIYTVYPFVFFLCISYVCALFRVHSGK